MVFLLTKTIRDTVAGDVHVAYGRPSDRSNIWLLTKVEADLAPRSFGSNLEAGQECF
jgi:hypothetical protein